MNNQYWLCYHSKNRLCVFKSFNDKIYVIYLFNPIKGFISYDLIDNKITTTIKNVTSNFTSIRHFSDKKNKKDLILTTTMNNGIRLWNFDNWECILNFIQEVKMRYMSACYSACFLTDKNINYIITSNFGYESDFIQVYNFEGKKIKEISSSNKETIYIENQYDTELNKNFIIANNQGHITSYDFEENKLYNKYKDNELDSDGLHWFYNDIIYYNDKKITKLISSKTYDFYIRIWDFHKGNLLNKINFNNCEIFGICLWNKSNHDYLLACSKGLNLIDLENKKIIGKFSGSTGLIIEKISDPNFGEYIISGCWDRIVLWENKNLIFNVKKIISDEHTI